MDHGKFADHCDVVVLVLFDYNARAVGTCPSGRKLVAESATVGERKECTTKPRIELGLLIQ